MLEFFEELLGLTEVAVEVQVEEMQAAYVATGQPTCQSR